MSDVESQKSTEEPRSMRSRMVSVVSLGLVVVGGALMVASTRSAEVKSAVTVDVQQERMARDLASSSSSQAHPGDLTTSTAGKGVFAESGPSKSPSTGIHKPTWKPTQGKPTEKPVEPWKEGSAEAGKSEKNTAHISNEKVMNLLVAPSKPAAQTGAAPAAKGAAGASAGAAVPPMMAASGVAAPAASMMSATMFDTGAAAAPVLNLLEVPAGASASSAPKAPKTATGPVLPLDVDVSDVAPAQPAGKGPAPAAPAPAAPAANLVAPGTGYIARKAQVSWETNMIAPETTTDAAPAKPAAADKAPAAGGAAKAAPADKAAGSAPAKTAGAAPAKTEGAAPVAALYMTSGYKGASPTKSPSTGLHKPTWKPSSKPAEHRELQVEKAAPAPKTDAAAPKDDKALAAKALEKKGTASKSDAPAATGSKSAPAPKSEGEKEAPAAPVKTDGPVDVPAPGPVHVSTPTMTPLTSKKPAEHRVLQTEKAAPAPKTDAAAPKDDKAMAAKALEKKGTASKSAAPAATGSKSAPAPKSEGEKEAPAAPVKTDGPVDVPAPGPVHVSTPTMTPLTSKKPAEHRELQVSKAAPAPKTDAAAPKDDKALAAKALEKKGTASKSAPAPKSEGEKEAPAAPAKTDGPVDVPAPGPVHVSTPTMTPLTSKKPAEHRELQVEKAAPAPKTDAAAPKDDKAMAAKALEKKGTASKSATGSKSAAPAPKGEGEKEAPVKTDGPVDVPAPGPVHVSTPTMTPLTSKKPAEHRVLQVEKAAPAPKTDAAAPKDDKAMAAKALEKKGTASKSDAPATGSKSAPAPKSEGEKEAPVKADGPVDVPAPGPVHVSTPTMTPLTSKKPAEHRALKVDEELTVPVRPTGTAKETADKTPAVLPPKSAGNANPAPVAALYMTSGYKGASPTKSPSTGLHKPTWKPSSKPAEHRTLQEDAAAVAAPAKPAAADKAPAAGGAAKAAPADKAAGSAPAKTAGAAPAKTEGAAPVAALYMTSGYKGASPTKSPSTGLHKPTWKPSSKPAEHRALSSTVSKKDAKVSTYGSAPSKSPSTGLHKPTWRPSSKPQESSKVVTPKDASSPSKSPSTGLHKPTWRPSSKPVESSKKSSSIGAALPRSLKEKKSEEKSEKKSEKKSEQVAPLTKPDGPVAPVDADAAPAQEVKSKATKSSKSAAVEEPVVEAEVVTETETKSSKKTKKSDPVAVAGLPEGVAAPEAGELLLPPVKNSKLGQIEGTVVAREA